MVVTNISIVGWLITVAENPPWRTFVMALCGVLALSLGILGLHRLIERYIRRIGDL